MITRRILLTACAAAALLPATAQAETLFVAETNDGYLNLRTGPGTGYGILLRLTAGTRVWISGYQGPWRQVVLPDGTTGWAHGRYLEPRFRQEREYQALVVPTNDGYLNLRAGPGTGYGILRRLHAGQRLFVLRWSGNWVNVQLPDRTTGWVSGRYISDA